MPRTPKTPPWKRENPHGKGEHRHLTPAQKAEARKRAEAAGRRYPNLVDNMAVLREHGAGDCTRPHA